MKLKKAADAMRDVCAEFYSAHGGAEKTVQKFATGKYYGLCAAIRVHITN